MKRRHATNLKQLVSCVQYALLDFVLSFKLGSRYNNINADFDATMFAYLRIEIMNIEDWNLDINMFE
jgi:hypothetical protein